MSTSDTESGASPAAAGAGTSAGAEVTGLRIALILATSAGGVGRHVRSLAAGLTHRGARVVVLGPAAVAERFGFAAAGAGFAEVDIADRPRPGADARAVARLGDLLRGADVAHAHGLRAGGLAALATGRRGAPPLAVTLHNAAIAGGLVGTAYRTLEWIVARRAARVLAVSPDLEGRMRELGAASVGRALVPSPDAQHPPADPGAARAAVRAELGAGERPIVLTVARLADQKGLPVLLDAAATWAARTPPPLVVIAGDGPLRASLETRVRARRLPVRLLGRRDDVPELFAAADVVAVPSVWEGQPLVVQEALRAGRPLVATEVGGVPDMVGDDAAVLVPAGDAAALTRAVAGVLDDPELAERLAAGARRRAGALPTEEQAVDQVAACYRSLAGRRV